MLSKIKKDYPLDAKTATEPQTYFHHGRFTDPRQPDSLVDRSDSDLSVLRGSPSLACRTGLSGSSLRTAHTTPETGQSHRWRQRGRPYRPLQGTRLCGGHLYRDIPVPLPRYLLSGWHSFTDPVTWDTKCRMIVTVQATHLSKFSDLADPDPHSARRDGYDEGREDRLWRQPARNGRSGAFRLWVYLNRQK